jgi:hypothetical protein
MPAPPARVSVQRTDANLGHRHRAPGNQRGHGSGLQCVHVCHRIVLKTSLKLDIRPLQTLEQECSLCKQNMSPELQLPLNAIIIEGYGMCPNRCLRVGPETESAYWYRRKWLGRIRAISKKKGWGWEYREGHGFQNSSR